MIVQLFISNNTFRQSCTFLSIRNLLVIQKICIFASTKTQTNEKVTLYGIKIFSNFRTLSPINGTYILTPRTNAYVLQTISKGDGTTWGWLHRHCFAHLTIHNAGNHGKYRIQGLQAHNPNLDICCHTGGHCRFDIQLLHRRSIGACNNIFAHFGIFNNKIVIFVGKTTQTTQKLRLQNQQWRRYINLFSNHI